MVQLFLSTIQWAVPIQSALALEAPILTLSVSNLANITTYITKIPKLLAFLHDSITFSGLINETEIQQIF